MVFGNFSESHWHGEMKKYIILLSFNGPQAPALLARFLFVAVDSHNLNLWLNIC